MLGVSQVVPGLIYATAHYRNGVMFAPLTVQLVRDLVFDAAPIRRFGISIPRATESCNIQRHAAAETG